jgi:nuclear transport factor 2 (NTF2) superfamily protein
LTYKRNDYNTGEHSDNTTPPLPPFDLETTTQKVRMAEDARNTRDPEKVSLAYTEYSRWRNRSEIFQGSDNIVALLRRKWDRELEYRLIKELWGFRENRMAVRFKYEWHDDAGNWYRAHGNELWEVDENGLMRRREASINDAPIAESERKFFWNPGPRPADHPGLTELGF